MYCNYSKDKFNNEITFIIPSWFRKEPTIEYHSVSDILNICKEFPRPEYNLEADVISACIMSEDDYFHMLEKGASPQQARQVLPNALKTELIMTGFVSDWDHFFDLRARGTTGAPHPDALTLAKPLMEEFERKGLI